MGEPDAIQEQINKVYEMFKSKHQQIVAERATLERDKAAFGEVCKVVTSFKDPIKLNVGGQIFMTSKATLMKKESMFQAMFSGCHKLEKDEGAYFIDRDPKHFGKILNFLRDGEFEMNDDETERKELRREADFYSMKSLSQYLVDRPPVDRQPVGLKFDLERKGPQVVVYANSATNSVGWQGAFSTPFTNGVHVWTINWTTGSGLIVGIAGASIVPSTSIYSQAYSMMLYNLGHLYVASSAQKQLFGFSVGASVTVEMNCTTRKVTWTCGTNKQTEEVHPNLQAPFSFCVDMVGGTTVTLK